MTTLRRSHVAPTPRRLQPAVRRRTLLQLALGGAGLALVGCTAPAIGNSGGSGSGSIDLAARPADDVWPAMFHSAPASVQEVYRYAVAHHDELQWMPCFCGCVDQGHTSNFDCFVSQVHDDGSVVLDAMGFG